MPSGGVYKGGRRVCKEKKMIHNFHDFLTNTSSIKVVKNTQDNLCLLRAVIETILKLIKIKTFNNIRKTVL